MDEKNSQIEDIINSFKEQEKRFVIRGEDCRYGINSNQNPDEPSHMTYYSLVFNKKDLVHLIKSTLNSKDKKLTKDIRGKYMTEYIVWEDACPMTEREPTKTGVKIELSLDLNKESPYFSINYKN